MKFRYVRYGSLLRPVIPVTVRRDGAAVTYKVLVDSGADVSVFDAELAEALGIELESGTMHHLFGVGAQESVCYTHEVVLEVGGHSFTSAVGFMPHLGWRVAPYGIVGQKGFFEFFKVTFDSSKEEIEIKKK